MFFYFQVTFWWIIKRFVAIIDLWRFPPIGAAHDALRIVYGAKFENSNLKEFRNSNNLLVDKIVLIKNCS